jgi:uncharacterized protein with PIN domain
VASSVRVRLARELWLFVAPRHRREQVEVRHDGTASLGHVVEALGVPLTEVGGMLVAGTLVTPSYQLQAGSTVEVRPVPRPQRVSCWRGQFVLDVHLGTLARRLRVLGIDAAYRNDAGDDALIEQANREHRVLLTQDRGLLRRRALWAGAHVRGTRSADQLADVLDRFAPPLTPFTRCTACNGELEQVSKQDVADELQPGTRRYYDAYARCRACRRVYWHGAHGRRLDAVVDVARRVTGGRSGAGAR